MDDLDQLRRLRAELPDPTPQALSAARTTLTNRIAAADAAPARPHRSLSWRSVLVRRLAIGVAGAAAVALGAGVVVATGANHGPTPPAGAAGSHSAGTPTVTTPGAALSLAADHTAKAGDPVLGRGRYRHVTTDSWHAQTIAGVHFLVKDRVELWQPAAADGVWWWRETGLVDWKFDSAADEQKVRAAKPGWLHQSVHLVSGHHGQPDRTPPGEPKVAHGQPEWDLPTPEFLAKQPRDPKKLLAAIEAAQQDGSLAKADRPTLAFLSIADALSSGIVPADLRASLYRAVKLIPGITLTSTSAKINGRKGVSVGKLSPYGIMRQEIVFDARSGEFLGERETVHKSIGDAEHLPVGSLYRSMAVTVDVTGNPKLF